MGKVTDPNILQELNATTAPATQNIPTLIPLAPPPGPTAREQAADVRAETSLGVQLGGEARAERAEQRDISRDQRQAISDLRKEFDQGYGRQFREIEASTRQVLGIAARTDNESMPGPADIALIIAYMKTLDPTSVVREGEQATAANAGGVPETIRNYYNRITTGAKLSPELRNEFANSVLNLYESRVPVYNREVGRYRNLIALEGGDPDVQGILLAPQLRPEEITIGADGEQPAGQVGRKVLGEAYVTPEDIERRDQIQAAWDSGATPEAISQLSQNLGLLPPTEEQMEVMRNARENDLPLSVQPNPTGQPTQLEGLLGAATQGPIGESVTGYLTGATNALTAGFAVPQEIKDYTRETAPVSSFMGELTGGALATIPAIRGMQGITAGTRLAPAAPLLGEITYGTLYGSGEAGEGNRVRGALTGGTGALVGGALINRFLPGGPGTFTGTPRPQAPTSTRFAGAQATPEELVSSAQQANIPLMTSDIMPPTTRMGKLGQLISEVAPFGTAGPRRQQQEAREQAVEDLLSEFGVSLETDVGQDLVRSVSDTRAANRAQWTGQKDEVIARLSNAGDVPAPRAVAAIDEQLASLRAQNLDNLNPLISQLENVRASLLSPGNLRNVENKRKTIFTYKGDPSLANVSTTAENAFTAVYNALNDDMGAFIRTAGGTADFRRWKTANTRLAESMGELKVAGLRGILNRGEFDPGTLVTMLTSVKPEQARLLFRNLNKEGRQNARLALIRDAARRALNPDTQVVNPSMFARNVEKLSDNFRQFFSASDMRRIEGLTEVLRATRRAQDAQFVPRTGEQLVPIGAASGLGGLSYALGYGALEGAAAAAAFGASRRFMESATARDLLLRISKASGTKKAELINQFLAGASATAGASIGEGMTRPAE